MCYIVTGSVHVYLVLSTFDFLHTNALISPLLAMEPCSCDVIRVICLSIANSLSWETSCEVSQLRIQLSVSNAFKLTLSTSRSHHILTCFKIYTGDWKCQKDNTIIYVLLNVIYLGQLLEVFWQTPKIDILKEDTESNGMPAIFAASLQNTFSALR